MHTHDQCSIFSTGGKFRSDYGLLLELHALTLVDHSYALLQCIYVYTATFFSHYKTVKKNHPTLIQQAGELVRLMWLPVICHNFTYLVLRY